MTNLAALELVARALGPMRGEVVFVGGSVRGLLITDPAAPPERPTDDVDVIVEIVSRRDYYAFASRLRARGFAEDSSEGAPICRWVVEDVRVDVMPTEEEILTFKNQWYAEAFARPVEARVGATAVRIVSAPYFCATKLDAFGDRGKGDFYHHDIEDFVALVDGREELVGEVALAPDTVRAYLAAQCRTLLGTRGFLDALPGHLAGDAASQARLPLVKERLRAIGDLGETGIAPRGRAMP